MAMARPPPMPAHDGQGGTFLGKGPTLQDRPPAQGFPKIRYQRNLPAKGPHGLITFIGGLGACLGGMYFVIEGRDKR
eukprot:gene30325-8655_t